MNLLKMMYKNASSRILVNGYLSESFQIDRSVRQGCPMSMILFSLYLEPLIRTLYKNMNGILIGNKFFKVFGYADDLTLVIRNEQEIDLILNLINEFSQFAKIKMNFRKSGFLRFNECKMGPIQIKEETKVKILGMIVESNYQL